MIIEEKKNRWKSRQPHQGNSHTTETMYTVDLLTGTFCFNHPPNFLNMRKSKIPSKAMQLHSCRKTKIGKQKTKIGSGANGAIVGLR